MAAVYVSNLVINTGATFTQKFTLENVSSNSALELSGFGVKSEMRKHSGSVAAAATFDQSSLGSQRFQNRLAEFTTPIDIPNAEGRSASINIISGAGTQGIVEFIRLKVKFNATQSVTLNDIGITLTSPSGTTHSVLQPFTNVAGQPTFYWAIGVAGFYGEALNGDWQVTVLDYSDDVLSPGAWEGFELEVYYR